MVDQRGVCAAVEECLTRLELVWCWFEICLVVLQSVGHFDAWEGNGSSCIEQSVEMVLVGGVG